ncbi:MAG: CapA family protein [Bacillota bacterium]|nr:CapA family protein [Bacillota bacterium]
MILEKKIRINLFVLAMLVLVAAVTMLTAGCGTDGIIGKIDGEPYDTIGSEISNEVVEPLLEPDIVKTITIAAVGDIMGHMPQVNAAYIKDERKYDFTDNFAEVRYVFVSSDIVVGNLETTLAGPDRGFSGYPMFNTPDELAGALAWAGFDVLSTANNHSLDRGESGVLRTLEVLKQHDLLTVGTASSEEDRDSSKIMSREGINVGFLAYTYGTNGIPIPMGKDYLVNLIDEELIANDIAKIRTKVDLVVVSMHWGNEYQREPNASQEELARKLIGWGADIILGSHPHVVQPMEFIEVIQEDGEARTGFVIYSLGNFISNQRDRYRDSGVILQIDVEKNFTSNKLEISEVNYISTWVHKYYFNNKWNYRILPTEDFIVQYSLGEDKLLVEDDYHRLIEVWNDTNKHLGQR